MTVLKDYKLFKPEYHFTIDKFAYTLDDMKGPYRIENGIEYESILFVADLPKYLIITTEHNCKAESNLSQVIYSKENHKAFLPVNGFKCVNTLSYNDKFITIQNDLFGYEPAWVGVFPERTLNRSPLAIYPLKRNDIIYGANHHKDIAKKNTEVENHKS